MLDIKELKQDMQARLSEKRFLHTESVVKTALKIRSALELNPELDYKLEVAGWLHDSCKELNNIEMILLAKFFKLEIYESDRIFPNLLHARVGAQWIEDEYEIYDPDIKLAIRDHTLGSEQMILTAKILFLADMIEPLRDQKQKASNPTLETDLDKIRDLVFVKKDLDLALLTAMDSKLSYTIKKSQDLHPVGVLARNSMLAVIKNRTIIS
jgi:predicted HD superfamily hydrolase involved in NAD metabolism